MTGTATSTSTPSSEPMNAPAEIESSASTPRSSSGSAANGISASRPAAVSASRQSPRMWGWRSARRPPSQYPTDSATSTIPIVFAHTIVEAPKYGASRRTAAISAPSEPVPTTKTRRGKGGIVPRRLATGRCRTSGRAGSFAVHGSRRRRPRPSLAPVHPAEGVGRRGAADRGQRRGDGPDRHPRAALHRRRVVALVQRARSPPPPDRRRRARAARKRRALDDAGPHAPARGRAGGQARGGRPARAHAGLLLGLRLDRGRDRAQDGVPVLGPARRGAAAVRGAAYGIPRRHDRVGVGRRDRPVSLALPAASVRHAEGGAGRLV